MCTILFIVCILESEISNTFILKDSNTSNNDYVIGTTVTNNEELGDNGNGNVYTFCFINNMND